jgi:hypothetical protein
MLFLGFPIKIWIAVIIAALIKLQSSKTLSVLGVLVTISVGIGAGVILYGPAIELLSLSPSWEIFIAILIALSAENLMRSFVELTANKDMLGDWLKIFINKKLEK